MARTKISEFSATPGNNTDIDGINISEGCAPSGINDAIRELMSQLKDFQAGTAGDSFNGPVGTTTAAAGAFTTLSASGAVTLSGGTANGVPYLNGSKVLTTGSALTFDGTTFETPTIRPTANVTYNLGSATRRWVSVFAGELIDGTDQLVGSSSTTARFGYGAGWTALSFAIGGSEQMRLTSTGLGIGTSSPQRALNVVANSSSTTIGGSTAVIQVGNSNGGSLGLTAGIELFGSGAPSAGLGNRSAGIYGLYEAFNGSGNAGALVFATNSAGSTSVTERARIDSSGNLLVGKTSTSSTATGVIAYGTGAADHGMISVARGSNATMIEFRTTASGNVVGQISQNGTNTTYSTSSDYRLKENIQPMTGALAFVRKQRPVTYNWKADGSEGAGYIAHWMQEDGAGNCVTGTKDAVDAEGKPVYQGIDTSFMVAPLNAAINELAEIVEAQAAIIEQLKADVAALKGA